MPPTHTDEGLVAAETIRRRWPHIGVLVLSQYTETEYALRLLEGGEERCGYLLKDRVLDAGQLADAVRRVGDGGVVVDPELVARLVGRSRPSSPLDEQPQLVGIVIALRKVALAEAAALIELGPPFDLAAFGIERHEMLLGEREVIFLFEGRQLAETMQQVVRDPAVWQAVSG